MRRILITGATSGIGLALACRFAARAELLLAGRRDEEAAREAIPPGCAYVRADQSRPEEAAATILRALDTLGWTGLDLAVLNAGDGRVADPAGEGAAAIRDTLDVNLVAAVALAGLLFPRLEAAGGRLALIGSTARRGAPRFASYAAAKAGLHGLARALHEEWRGKVFVQAIHPGPTATAMHARAGLDPGPAGRFFARAETMAALIEKALASNRPVVTLSFAQVLLGGRGR